MVEIYTTTMPFVILAEFAVTFGYLFWLTR
jgi:hypothetical protein